MIRTNLMLEQCTPSDYCEIIATHEEKGSEAAYYLLKRRLSLALKKVYEEHGFGLIEEFDDTIDDFFLYLYDDNPGLGQRPFSILENIRDKNAFFGWVVSTYRIFLLNKAKDKEREWSVLSIAATDLAEEKPWTDELMIRFLANAIAFADQQFVSLKRFLFYRMLLSFLDHRQAIPQEEMARALNMNAVTYRVYTKRQKDRFLEFINIQEAGGTLSLNPTHEAMRDMIMSRFNQLYQVLMVYYARVVQELPNATAIAQLRREFSRDKETMMHEDLGSYGFGEIDSIESFYRNMKAYLGRSSIGG